jgi:hypothetical protein
MIDAFLPANPFATMTKLSALVFSPYAGAIVMGAAAVGAVGTAVHAYATIPPPADTTLGKCKAKAGGETVELPDHVVKNMKPADSSKAAGKVVDAISKALPDPMGKKFGHAILCGAHVVLKNEDKQFDEFMRPLAKDLESKFQRFSSHYDGTEQYGIDVVLLEAPKLTGHLLIGKTSSGETFFQLEKHGTGLHNVLPHMYDYLQHKMGGKVQVGPMGYIQASEKKGTELIVSGGSISQKSS